LLRQLAAAQAETQALIAAFDAGRAVEHDGINIEPIGVDAANQGIVSYLLFNAAGQLCSREVLAGVTLQLVAAGIILRKPGQCCQINQRILSTGCIQLIQYQATIALVKGRATSGADTTKTDNDRQLRQKILLGVVTRMTKKDNSAFYRLILALASTHMHSRVKAILVFISY
jgi:hypothetical protein